jgi:hypothetical protein
MTGLTGEGSFLIAGGEEARESSEEISIASEGIDILKSAGRMKEQRKAKGIKKD